jgi:hypothetical protein
MKNNQISGVEKEDIKNPLKHPDPAIEKNTDRDLDP